MEGQRGRDKIREVDGEGDGVVRHARDILVQDNRDLPSSTYVSWPGGFQDEWIMVSVLMQFAI